MAESTALPAVERFAQRLATRDQPEPLKFDEASVRARLRAGIVARWPKRHEASYDWLTDVVIDFMNQPVWNHQQLEARWHRWESSINNQLRPLIADGIFERFLPNPADRRLKAFRLSRAGEDWVQHLVQAPLPPSA